MHDWQSELNSFKGAPNGLYDRKNIPTVRNALGEIPQSQKLELFPSKIWIIHNQFEITLFIMFFRRSCSEGCTCNARHICKSVLVERE